MTDERPRLSELLQSAPSLEASRGQSYALTLADGVTVKVTRGELFSPAKLQRALTDELGRVPVNDYPEIDAQASGVHALEDDIDALLARTGERGDE